MRRLLATAARRPTFPQLLRLKLPGTLSAWADAGFARNGDADDMALGLGGVDVGIGSSDCIASWGWRDGREARGVESEPAEWPCPPNA